jgi:hypothetical protein
LPWFGSLSERSSLIFVYCLGAVQAKYCEIPSFFATP